MHRHCKCKAAGRGEEALPAAEPEPAERAEGSARSAKPPLVSDSRAGSRSGGKGRGLRGPPSSSPAGGTPREDFPLHVALPALLHLPLASPEPSSALSAAAREGSPKGSAKVPRVRRKRSASPALQSVRVSRPGAFGPCGSKQVSAPSAVFAGLATSHTPAWSHLGRFRNGGFPQRQGSIFAHQ